MVSGFAREGKSCLRSVELSMDWIAKRAEEWLARRWGMFPARESLVDRVESREEEREKAVVGLRVVLHLALSREEFTSLWPPFFPLFQDQYSNMDTLYTQVVSSDSQGTVFLQAVSR